MYYPTDIRTAKRGYEDEGVGGWISPEGIFFQANYYNHYEVAVDVIRGYLRTSYYSSPSEYLIDRGWIRLETNGIVNHPYVPTIHQLDVLYQLYTLGGTSYYTSKMYKHIKPVLDTNQVREPMQPLPGQGDQENHHWTPELKQRIWQCAFCNQEGVYA